MPRRPLQQIVTGESFTASILPSPIGSTSISSAQVRPTPAVPKPPSGVDGPQTTIIQELISPARPIVSKPNPTTARPPLRTSRPSPTSANGQKPWSDLTKYIRPIGAMIGGGMMLKGFGIFVPLGGIVVLNGAADIGYKAFGAKEGDILAQVVYDKTDPIERFALGMTSMDKQTLDIIGAILFLGSAAILFRPSNRIPSIGAALLGLGEVAAALEPEFNSPKPKK